MNIESAQGMAVQHPNTFEVSDIDHMREVVKPGVYAKICILDGGGERIWTKVIKVDGDKVRASLANDPFGLEGMKHGDRVEYQMHNVYNVTSVDGEELA
jgi:hypothetical protein